MTVITGRHKASRCGTAGSKPREYIYLVNRFFRRFCRLRTLSWVGAHYQAIFDRWRG